MKVIVFGATGMIGQGVMRECLADPEITEVLTVGRSASGVQQPKVRELVHRDLYDYSAVEEQLRGYDACLFCLGVSSSGMDEAAYAHVTYDLTLAAANTLVRLNPAMTFEYVSGAGTDSSEKGRTMWARVKGRTENALLKLPFARVYNLRPGFILPMHGIVSRTGLYRTLYAVLRPMYPVMKAVAPGHLMTTESLGRAMVRIAKSGAPKGVLEAPDLNELAR